MGISGHLTIHDNAVVYAQSGVGGDVAAGAVISGSPAFDAREWLRAITAFQKLPEILKTVRQLERRIRSTEEACEPTNMPRHQDYEGRHLPLAYRNREFLDGPEGRSLRILSEYLYPLSHFRRERVHDTVVFFGSARLMEMGPLGRYYNEARELARRLTAWSDGLPDSDAPLCGVQRRRSRHHGSGQPRRLRRRGQDRRPEYRPAL